MSLYLAKEMLSYDMDLDRNEGEESKINAKFIHGTGFTIAFWKFKPHAIIPEHTHEHETATTILKGSLRLTVDGRTVYLHAGDSFIIPSWAIHDAEALEPSEVIDVYTPVREDYLARQNGSIKTYLNASQKRVSFPKIFSSFNSKEKYMLHSYDYDVITGKNGSIPNKLDIYLDNNQFTSWNPSSWNRFPIEQNPEYPDKCSLDYFQNCLKNYPPLVLASEIRNFKKTLNLATEGKAFILQCGDCAESFDNCQSTIIRDLVYTINQMSGLIHQSTHLPIIRIGRLAGQYAKPRSDSFEIQNGNKLPSYRGDIINGVDFNEKSRIPDPQRMLHAYHYSSATLNLIRAINSSEHPKYQYQLNIKVYPGSTEKPHYISFLESLYKTANYLSNKENMAHPMLISHEALLLPYEEAMTSL